jgi:hypothetical protein
MSWRCIFRRRRFVPYLDGELSPREARRLEKHLADCRVCGELFARLRAGHQAGRQFGRIGPGTDHRPPEFDELWREIGPRPDARGKAARDERTAFAGRPLAPAARVLTAVAAAGIVILAMSNPKFIRRGGEREALSKAAFESAEFTPVRIREFPSITRAPVVTEGFVRAVYFDEQEKTLHIKLVEIPQKSEPFVICEIRSREGMAIPAEGSRIRVYGMARYDAQPGRRWHEVNPVLTMAVLKR